MELHLTLNEIALLELINVSYYMHRYNRDTGLYIVRFTCGTEYSKARYKLGADTKCR